MLSVILPAFNAQKTLARAINSLLVQTFSDFELIVINDGSTDGTRNIIEQFTDSRIKAIHLTKNVGLIDALNLGLTMAKGRYIARMDADDISLPERFAEQIAFLDAHPDYIACGTSIINFTETSEHGLRESYMRYPTSDEEIRVALHFFERNICHPTVMFRSSAIKEQGICYRKEYPHAEDYRLWIELSKLGKLHNLPKGLVKYYRHQEQISAKYYPEQIAISKRIVRDLIRETWPAISDDLINAILKLCVHQQGVYPSSHFTLKELDRTITAILLMNRQSRHFDVLHLKRILYFKRFRCSFYYFYHFNYLTKLRCFMRFFSVEPKRAGEDLIMQARVFYINRINKWS
uniref:glycosyltransferase family 2 protein n=1 Tax=Thaumasiovibrio occultus TaxID=1891184 RepID=UPI000B35BDC4|nr:glycosyltransferase family 2 protein [Thaumasiovibrio occultus]